MIIFIPPWHRESLYNSLYGPTAISSSPLFILSPCFKPTSGRRFTRKGSLLGENAASPGLRVMWCAQDKGHIVWDIMSILAFKTLCWRKTHATALVTWKSYDGCLLTNNWQKELCIHYNTSMLTPPISLLPLLPLRLLHTGPTVGHLKHLGRLGTSSGTNLFCVVSCSGSFRNRADHVVRLNMQSLNMPVLSTFLSTYQ